MKSKWVKKWPIEVVKSIRSREKFVKEGEPPYWITHQSLVFIITTTFECITEHKEQMKVFNLANMRGYLENLEKRFFLHTVPMVGGKYYPEYELPIKPEGMECLKIPTGFTFPIPEKPSLAFDVFGKPIFEVVENEEIQEVIDRLDDDKKIVMTDRIGWQKKVAEDYLTTEYCVRYRKRLGLGIIPKDAVKEKA